MRQEDCEGFIRSKPRTRTVTLTAAFPERSSPANLSEGTNAFVEQPKALPWGLDCVSWAQVLWL